jgi:hypothetical protein
MLQAFQAFISLSIHLNFTINSVALSQLDEEVIDIESPVCSVSADVESIRPDCTPITPASESAGMDVQNAGHFLHCHKGCDFIVIIFICHSFIPISLKKCLATEESLPLIMFYVLKIAMI